MKLPLIFICLLMSFSCSAMNENQTTEKNRINLEQALECAKKKNPTEIVIFQYTKTQKQESVCSDYEQGSVEHSKQALKNLENQLIGCCPHVADDICFKIWCDETIVPEKEKMIVYLSQLKFPLNHNDNDSWSLKNYFDTLKKNQATTPFMIATDNDITTRDLGSYLERQYPDDVIVYFPAKRGYFFTQPFVIVGGIVAMVGLWYFLFKRGY